MTKVKYICKNNHRQFFEEEGEEIRSLNNSTVWLIPTEKHIRICERCGLVMDGPWSMGV